MTSSRKKHADGKAADKRRSGPTGEMQLSEGVSFAALPTLAAPTAAYKEQLARISEFKRDIADELMRIADAASKQSKRSGGNAWETPRKRELSALVELARMDYMESPSVSALLHRESHLAATDADERAELEASDAWREVAHVLSLYEELRRNLVIQTVKKSKRRMAALLAVEFVLTAMYVPLFAMSIVLCLPPLQAVWVALGVRNHFFPVDLVQKLYARAFLALCGVQVQWHGMQHISYIDSTIGMFSHASNLDPFVVASGPLAFKWIGKASLFRIPVMGWLLTGLQHISIERTVRERAIASLRKAADIVLKHKRCIAVSPEGTRSRTGRMADFKKGAFHTAMQVGVPITPLLIEGAYDLWPSGAIFAMPGTVHVYVLEPIAITKDDTYNSLASKVRRRFLQASLKNAREAIRQLQPGTTKSKEKSPNFNFAFALAFAPAVYMLTAFIIRSVSSAVSASTPA